MLRQLVLLKPYFSKKKMLERTEFLSVDAIERVQKKMLRKVLQHAVISVPFYQKRIDPKIFCRENDPFKLIKKFPIVGKKIIRGNIDEFVCGSSIRRLKVTTGGSTGQPFEFYMDRFNTRQMEKAFIHDQWERVGYKFGDSIFNLRGRTPKKKFIHHDILFNIYYASSFDLNRNCLDKYISAIKEIEPKFVHGYPSTIYLFAKLIEASGRKLEYSPKAVFCGSEKLFNFQRKIIQEVFNCRVYSWYGHSECLALGGECEYSSNYHFYPQYGYTELHPSPLFNDSNKNIAEIVATGFNNYVMPLIRYKTGDYAIVSNQQFCQCGRNYLIVEDVVGRESEFVIDIHQNPVSATSLIFGQHYPIFSAIDAIQICQEKPGVIEIRMVKNKMFEEYLLLSMKSKLLEIIGESLQINYIFVKSLEQSPIGKAKLVEQKLNVLNYF